MKDATAHAGQLEDIVRIMETRRIVACRHPEKDAQGNITPYGASQAFAQGQQLRALGFDFNQVRYSGAHRTWQTAMIMLGAMGKKGLLIIEEPRFHFQTTLNDIFDGEGSRCLSELALLRSEFGDNVTVQQAWKNSVYARRAAAVVSEAVVGLVTNPPGDSLVLSHSPWIECAGRNLVYGGLREADAVLYVVENGEIKSAEIILAPLEGKTN